MRGALASASHIHPTPPRSYATVSYWAVGIVILKAAWVMRVMMFYVKESGTGIGLGGVYVRHVCPEQGMTLGRLRKMEIHAKWPITASPQ